MLWSAFVIGFVGSLHCLGMCGPIVLVLPGDSSQRVRFTIGRLLYNLGRAITYAMMGAIAGMAGLGASMAGVQQWMGILAGSLMTLSVLLPSKVVYRLFPSAGSGKILRRVKSKLGSLLSNSSHSSTFLIGILNGFLPCGLVYIALAGSLIMSSVGGGALYMFIFGLGTLPVMFAASFVSGLITGTLRKRIRKIIPVAVFVMGVLFILRGLSLGIPFISPDIDRMKKKAEHSHTDHPVSSMISVTSYSGATLTHTLSGSKQDR